MRLLTLKIDEPVPGRVLPEMAVAHGPEEAARRYRAIVVTTLRQLGGLQETRLRLQVTPEDGHEAVRFWLLPKLADTWLNEGDVFRSHSWEIDFGGDTGAYPIRATGEILCPNLGARWVHAALLGMGRSTHRVIGPAIGGGEYFLAHADDVFASSEPRILPPLPVIQTNDHWLEALDGPLGPALKKAWEEHG